MVTVANDPARNVRDVPGANADGVVVADLFGLPALAGATVLAGGSGLGRRVRGVNVMEVPDILEWVKPDELLLTTAFPLTRSDDSSNVEQMVELVGELHARGLAALGVKLGRYLDAVPPPVLERADELDFPIIRLPDAVAFDEVLAEVFPRLLDRQSAALQIADELHRAIATIVLDGGGLPQIAAELSRLLDQLVLIATPDGRVLAEAGAEPHLVVPGQAGLLDRSGRLLVERLRDGHLVLGAGERRAEATMTSIVAGGVDHGRIVAFRAGVGNPAGVQQALERAAIVAALTITKELAVAAVEGKFRGDYLRDVLTGLVGVDESVIEHCHGLGWNIDRPLVVVVAELDPAPSDRAVDRASGSASIGLRSHHERLTSAWQQVVRSRDRAAPVVGFSQEIVALLPVAGDPVRAVDDVVAAVRGDRGGGRQSFSAGVSRIVATPLGVASGYAQARKAVAVGRRVHGPGSVSHFDSLGVHRLLSLVPDGAELTAFAAEVLAELVGDGPEAADLRLTLQTLLDTNLNVAETARLLHFHYNTLRYRIGKLERIVGPFTTDPHLRLDVALALQVVQMRGI